jgi:hypothetical protein
MLIGVDVAGSAQLMLLLASSREDPLRVVYLQRRATCVAFLRWRSVIYLWGEC